MRAPVLMLATLTGLLLPGTAALVQEHIGGQSVTPTNEQRPPLPDTPSITRKVSVESLGSLDLSKENGALNEKKLRTRRITIAPGGSVAWHQHQQRPGVAYLIEGSLTEVYDSAVGVSDGGLSRRGRGL